MIYPPSLLGGSELICPLQRIRPKGKRRADSVAHLAHVVLSVRRDSMLLGANLLGPNIPAVSILSCVWGTSLMPQHQPSPWLAHVEGPV